MTTESSLQPVILPLTPEAADLLKQVADSTLDASSLTEVRRLFLDLPFNTLYDLMRAVAMQRMTQGELDTTLAQIDHFDTLLRRHAAETSDEAELRRARDTHAALMQTRTALLIDAGSMDRALETAAATLSLLVQEAKRKDEPFMSVLALLLYDLAMIHNARAEYKQAERSIDKALKLFERLAAKNPARYGAAHIVAMASSTTLYRSRLKQTNALAHHQVASSSYMIDVDAGVEGALLRLIESLTGEGETLAKMNRHREAIQYYTRALKYLTRIEPDFTPAQLHLSVMLGESLVNIKAMRDKGIHLLNTMIQKAIRLDEPQWRERAEAALARTNRGTTDILAIWHKLFPR